MPIDLILQASPVDVDLVQTMQVLTGTQDLEYQADGVRLLNVPDDAGIRTAVREACDAQQVDHAFMTSDARLSDFGLSVMDMDSTLITIECIDEIADLHGLKPQVAAITEAAMRGEIADFSESLRRRVALLAGLDESALQRVFDERLCLSPGAENLLEACRSAGLKTLLVSGGFSFFTERLKKRLGLDFAHANSLEIQAGRLTGRVAGSIIDADAKARLVIETCTQMGISPERAIVMGDGANDLKMMHVAGMSVAYHAKPVVRTAASHSIQFGGLDRLPGWFKT